jgi:hypothetical protein
MHLVLRRILSFMASPEIPEGDPIFPWRVTLDAYSIERMAALVLCEKFPEWQNDEAWREFEAEVVRLGMRVGSGVLKSLIYTEGENSVLGIFIRKDRVPKEGVQALF